MNSGAAAEILATDTKFLFLQAFDNQLPSPGFKVMCSAECSLLLLNQSTDG